MARLMTVKESLRDGHENAMLQRIIKLIEKADLKENCRDEYLTVLKICSALLDNDHAKVVEYESEYEDGREIVCAYCPTCGEPVDESGTIADRCPSCEQRLAEGWLEL